MEKLIELLNEYGKGTIWAENAIMSIPELVISKNFGFIKRLVDNDKIDKKKIDTRLVRYVESHYDEEGYWVENSYEDYELYECLLMLLSIQDSPIEFLISILK